MANLRKQGGASAPLNIVVLPTSAKRKIKQDISGEAYRDALEECARFPMEPRFEATPYFKGCQRTARLMMSADRAAMMQLALALFTTASEEHQAKATERLRSLEEGHKAGADEALAWLDFETASETRQLTIAAEFMRIKLEEAN